MNIKEDVVRSIARKLSGILVPSGTELEAPQGWLLKSGEDIKNCISVGTFFEWIANKNPPWTA